ncbi:MAG TPA: pyridoxamine 5'-phosphate oxidase family protein [Acetobacteraceae bacterium]|jgi:hypothetical protein|nr:pyridoxamine 5'-phosphate oxidase family protein [Acetobacteraceae bacterium]
MSETAPTEFTRVRRMPKRGVYDRAVVHAILDATPLCHIGHIIAGRPVVVPTFHWRHGETVFWHGSSASRMLRANAAGGEVCLNATVLDGFVLARSAFHHSANYRSVMCFGVPRLIADPTEKEAAMEGFVERMAPGRWPLLRPVSLQEVKATSILALDLDEVSAKVRTGGPVDDDEDLEWPVWAGVVPVDVAVGRGAQEAGQPADLEEPVITLVVG